MPDTRVLFVLGRGQVSVEIVTNSRGPPNNDCRDELETLVHNNALTWGGVLLGVGVVGMLAFGFSFAICYVKTQRNNPAAKFRRHAKDAGVNFRKLK